MQDYRLALTTLETEEVAVAEEESSLEQLDFDDPTVPTLDTVWPTQQCRPSAPPAAAAGAPQSTTPSPPTALPATPSPTAPPVEPSTHFPVATTQSSKFIELLKGANNCDLY